MRSKPAPIRKVTPDPIYGSPTVTKLINSVMFSGKRSVAQKQVYQALEILRTKYPDASPLSTMQTALENIKPQMEVRSRRIGGAAYQVPAPVRGPRRESLALRWLIAAANAQPSSQYHSFAAKLAAEISEALNNTGSAVKKKNDTHRMAEANKAFAHFRW